MHKAIENATDTVAAQFEIAKTYESCDENLLSKTKRKVVINAASYLKVDKDIEMAVESHLVGG